jgi:hypothetical protein
LVRFDDGQGHFVHDLAVLGVRVAGCPGSTGPIQSEFGVGANPFFVEHGYPRSVRVQSAAHRHAKGLSREALAHEADMDQTDISSPGRGM